jgi:hypothetical protein
VDFPLPGGAGNTNTGNTSRRAFQDPSKLAAILNLDKIMVSNMKDILVAISTTQHIDPVAFGKLCRETLNIWIEKYKFYTMPVTLHKVLVHGQDIMSHSLVPLGFLSEEASENCNKLYKNYRQFHARKTSQEDNLSDIFYRRMEASDPLISSLNEKKMKSRKKKMSLPESVKKMLIDPHTSDDDDDDDNGNNEFDDDENIDDFNSYFGRSDESVLISECIFDE